MERIEAVKDRSEFHLSFGDAEAQRFLDLLDAVENVSFYDEAVLSIVSQEAAAYFAGDKSAEETARLIQSRVGLYVSEQS